MAGKKQSSLDRVLGRIDALDSVNLASVDTGDFVVVINAEKVVLTGKKEEQNEYMFFSGFVGGESYRNVPLMRQRNPAFIIEHAVKGMLPKNRIAAKMLTKLRVFAGTTHPHEANNPVPVSF